MTAQGAYARTAAGYRSLGWPNPIPVAGKFPPVKGFTGRDGAHVTEADVRRWCQGGEGHHNIALRLHDGVLGVDVDAHDGKQGASTVAKAHAELGELPATWSVTSRGAGQPSRIHLFRVPEGLDWSGAERHLREFGDHVDVLHPHHRYAMVAPSEHPATRRPYRWYRPAGAASGQAPRPGDLAELPAGWVELLTERSPKPEPPQATFRPATTGGRYARGALERARQAILGAPVGDRNNTAFREGAALFELVAGGVVDELDAVAALTDALQQVGLPPCEIPPTIGSARRRGFQRPRGLPADPPRPRRVPAPGAALDEKAWEAARNADAQVAPGQHEPGRWLPAWALPQVPGAANEQAGPR